MIMAMVSITFNGGNNEKRLLKAGILIAIVGVIHHENSKGAELNKQVNFHTNE